LKKRFIKTNDNYVSQVAFHILLGVILFLFTPFAKVYFIIVVVYFLIKIFTCPNSKRVEEILFACAYISGSEVLFRMTKGAISYEACKYLVIMFVLIGLFFKGINSGAYPYFFFLIALVPAIIVASKTLGYQSDFRRSIAFVLSGPVCLGLATLFTYDKKITNEKILKVLLYLGLPSITMTTYLFLYNPTIRDTLSGTASNAATSGGFGPNQVSTALGLGIFAIVVRLFMKSPTIFLKVLNLVILGGMAFRGIVTFSRGGIYAAIIISLAFLVIVFLKSSEQKKSNMVVTFVVFMMAISVTWVISSNQTRGLIDKRYANEDSLGRDKGDITTGRLALFEEEMEGFLSNPFFGVGASRIKDIRLEEKGLKVPSHNEVGRLLSEHGILGIIILLILIIKPLVYRANNKKSFYFYAFFGFWFATINHSGMRIAAPAFLYALCLLNITNEKSPVHRKQITK
jgi:hypothetical protein